jgi:hypothetical protein
MEVRGLGAAIQVHEDRLVIVRHGALSFVTHGLKGEKTIPFSSIVAVQFKSAGLFHNGYIQFGIIGGVESRRGLFDAAGDENSVIFQHAHEPSFLELKRLVEERMARGGTPAAPTVAVGEELERLARLLTAGVLSGAEFQEQKRRLLATPSSRNAAVPRSAARRSVEYKGVRYTLLPDYRVEATVRGQSHYWPSLFEFRRDVDQGDVQPDA